MYLLKNLVICKGRTVNLLVAAVEEKKDTRALEIHIGGG